jgi:hypothetical protein
MNRDEKKSEIVSTRKLSREFIGSYAPMHNNTTSGNLDDMQRFIFPIQPNYSVRVLRTCTPYKRDFTMGIHFAKPTVLKHVESTHKNGIVASGNVVLSNTQLTLETREYAPIQYRAYVPYSVTWRCKGQVTPDPRAKKEFGMRNYRNHQPYHCC